MKLFLMVLIGANVWAVAGEVSKVSYSREDLVLIEFAARLEEDYHKMHPGAAPTANVVPALPAPPAASPPEPGHVPEPHHVAK
jgi:hypothetical protein